MASAGSESPAAGWAPWPLSVWVPGGSSLSSPGRGSAAARASPIRREIQFPFDLKLIFRRKLLYRHTYRQLPAGACYFREGPSLDEGVCAQSRGPVLGQGGPGQACPQLRRREHCVWPSAGRAELPTSPPGTFLAWRQMSGEPGQLAGLRLPRTVTSPLPSSSRSPWIVDALTEPGTSEAGMVGDAALSGESLAAP